LSANGIQIEKIRTHRVVEEFARLPLRVYENCDAWWPPDVDAEIELLAGRSPISSYLELMPMVVRRDGLVVARVTAAINHRYIDHWHEPLGHLIHFEAMPNEREGVVAMLEEAAGWLRSRGMQAARSGFAAFLDYPFAIDNYGALPSFLLRGSPNYYHCYFKNAGFWTEKGLLDYTVALEPPILARYQSILEGARASGVTIQNWRECGFLAAIDTWTDVTNAAFARHWGWNPVARTEVRPMLSPLRDTAVAELSMVASIDGEAVGAVFSVPDFSPALAHVRPGVRLAPERGGGTRGALINIAVVENARGRGVAIAMAARSFFTMAQLRMRYAGYTLVLDDNWPSRRTAEGLGAHVTGNFVAYRRDL
jgi:hypothetical protein